MAPTTLEGRTLGKYSILEPLGRGGMSQVYRAYHRQLDRFVAIKVLRSDLVEETEFLNRFRREARSVAALRHPHIVQVYDFDTEGDLYYMVMELLEGDTLKARLNTYRARGQAMPCREMVRILVDVLDGLAYAHGEGIIHRDLKPANILLTRRGEAVLTDFGIAQIVGGTNYTASGVMMGTVQYMSPEQGLGSGVDFRSDLYSLGVVVFEMLTGRPPFDADTPLAILMKHLNDPLPLPQKPDPALPEVFERVLLKALAKRPEDRYQSAGEMAQALLAAGAACPVDAAEISRAVEASQLPEPKSSPSASAEEKPRLVQQTTQPPQVLSGTDRQSVPDAQFAADVTDPDLGKAFAGARPAAPSLKAAFAPFFSASADSNAETPRRWVPLAAVAGSGFLVGANILAISIGPVAGWAPYRFGWPVEMILVGILLSLLMAALPQIWLLIPAGILIGNGLIFSFYSLSAQWSLWALCWPAEPLLVGGAIWLSARLARRPGASRWLARRLGLLLASFSILIVFLIGWATLIAGAVTRLFH